MKTEAILFRQELHENPELSGAEHNTAARIKAFLNKYSPDKLYDKIGGEGILAMYDIPVPAFSGVQLSFYSSIVAESLPATKLLFRCEIDALPIEERSDLPYRSKNKGVAHLCGHDGHMAMMCCFAAELWNLKHTKYESATDPEIVSVFLLFQPAEETGEGAAKVAVELNRMGLKFDLSFALHNRPGHNTGDIIITEGTYAYASTGIEINLLGHTAHAAEPELAISPINAIARIIIYSNDTNNAYHNERLCTIVYIETGEKAYGTTPGFGTIGMTIRARNDASLSKFKSETELFIHELAAEYGLGVEIKYHDYFPATVNSNLSNEILHKAAISKGLKVIRTQEALPASDDFAHLTIDTNASFVDVGSGRDHPALHEPDFDFPDEIIDMLF